jgi:hypothetical protein
MARLFGFDYKSPYFYPRFGSRAGSFLTQRRKGAEKTVFLCFLKVIFIFATPYKRHPIGEDSLRQKNSCIFL